MTRFVCATCVAGDRITRSTHANRDRSAGPAFASSDMKDGRAERHTNNRGAILRNACRIND
jgi:hypothetical protein